MNWIVLFYYYHLLDIAILQYWMEYISLYWFTETRFSSSHLHVIALMKDFYVKYDEVERFKNIAFRYSILYIDAFYKDNKALSVLEVQDELRNRFMEIISVSNFDLKLLNHLDSVVLVFTKNLDTLLYTKRLISFSEWKEWHSNQLKFVELIINEWPKAKEKCFMLHEIDFKKDFENNFLDYIVIDNFLTYIEHFILNKPFNSSCEEIKFRESLCMEFELNYFLGFKNPLTKTEQWLRYYLYDVFGTLKLKTIDTEITAVNLRFPQTYNNFCGTLKMKRALVQMWHPKKYYFW